MVGEEDFVDYVFVFGVVLWGGVELFVVYVFECGGVGDVVEEVEFDVVGFEVEVLCYDLIDEDVVG